jgi:hypothetical protein
VGGQWVEPMLRAILVIVVGIWFWSEAENDLGCVNVSRRCGCVLSLRVRVGVRTIALHLSLRMGTRPKKSAVVVELYCCTRQCILAASGCITHA